MSTAIEVVKIATQFDLELIATNLPKKSDGTIKPSYTAMCQVVAGLGIYADTFLNRIMMIEQGHVKMFEEADYVNIAIRLEEIGFYDIVMARLKEVVKKCAWDNRIDSAQIWINSLRWDGVDRCSNMFSRYFGAEESDYTNAASQYFVTAMAGRVIRPGIQADMVPVLVGAQGARKTTAVKALAPLPDTFTEIDLSAKNDANLSRQMRGKLIGELGELRGLKTKESESIKAWVTRTHEEWTPKYSEFSTIMPRRCVFIGTTNEDEFLADQTGNRRWLPMTVVNQCDPEAIERDRDQIWAQAAQMFITNEVVWGEAERLAENEHGNHTLIDQTMLEAVRDALNGINFIGNHKIRLRDVAKEVYGPDRMITVPEERRIGAALKELGYIKNRTRLNGIAGVYWMPPEGICDQPF